MLLAADRFIDMPVMSLQTGSELARTAREIIDPRNLTIVAYELEGPLLDMQPSLLRVADIREIGQLGMIIDSADELISPSDVIKIKEIYEFAFELTGKPVLDEQRHKIGRVIGYTLRAGDFVVQQLRVRRPLLKSFGDIELLIHRSQIIQVSDDHIIVKTPAIRHKEPIAPTAAGFENPFRQSRSATESMELGHEAHGR